VCRERLVDSAVPLPQGDLAEKKRVITDEWLDLVLRTYPENSSRLLRIESDPFRNPVGQTLKEGLSVLVDEILGGMTLARITPALNGIVRMRAVQDFTAGQAVAFIFLLRDVVRMHLGEHKALLELAERRIDHLAVEASDLFMACREKMYEIKAEALKRSMYVQTRIDRKRAVN